MSNESCLLPTPHIKLFTLQVLFSLLIIPHLTTERGEITSVQVCSLHWTYTEQKLCQLHNRHVWWKAAKNVGRTLTKTKNKCCLLYYIFFIISLPPLQNLCNFCSMDVDKKNCSGVRADNFIFNRCLWKYREKMIHFEKQTTVCNVLSATGVQLEVCSWNERNTNWRLRQYSICPLT